MKRHMRRTNVFTGSGIGVRYWSGSDGDVFCYEVPVFTKRSEIPWVGIMFKGGFVAEKCPPTYVHVDAFTCDGLVSYPDLPDLPAGDYEFRCVGETEYVCIGTIDEQKLMSFEDFDWKYLTPGSGEQVFIPAKSVLVIAEGDTDAGASPRIVHAKSRDVNLTFHSRGRAIWAKSRRF